MSAHGVESVAFRLRRHVLIVVVLPLPPRVSHESGVVTPVQASPVMQHWGGRAAGGEGTHVKHVFVAFDHSPFGMGVGVGRYLGGVSETGGEEGWRRLEERGVTR